LDEQSPQLSEFVKKNSTVFGKYFEGDNNALSSLNTPIDVVEIKVQENTSQNQSQTNQVIPQPMM
jgi:hypothetical protein